MHAHQIAVILQCVSDGILVQTASRIVYANDAAATMLGYGSVHALLATPPDNLLERVQLTDEDGLPFLNERLPGRLVLQGERYAETIVQCNDGQTAEGRWAKVQSWRLTHTTGQARLAVTILHDITDRRRGEQMRQQALIDERARISRELHDNLAQVLVYVNAQALAAAKLLQDGKLERAAGEINQLARTARMAYADVRESILGLRRPPGSGPEFLSLLRDHLLSWRRQSGMQAELTIVPPTDFAWQLPAETALQLMRIIQEALTNIVKHSAAHLAQVSLALAEGWVEAVIADDGAGFDPEAHVPDEMPHFGLAMMGERAHAAGGAFAVESSPGKGTRVIVHLPTDMHSIGAVGG